MKTILSFSALLFACTFGTAQILKTMPEGGNKKAMIGEQIGITDVTIHYDRPGVKGREDKIYGSVVHKGYEDLGFGTSKAAPWRAGANENTTIEFSTPVKINGLNLAAGKYGLFVAYDPAECTVIFSKNSTSWGSYFYSEKEDALRLKVKPTALDKSVEWLKFEFMNQTENSAVIALQWEKLSIPFKVEVDLVATRLENYRLALRSGEGFRWETCAEAANFCLANETSLEEGLQWSKDALMFDENFTTLSTNAALLNKTGYIPKSDSVMNVALESGKMMDLHMYGRKLLFQKKPKEALDVFKLNAKKNPKQFTPLLGLVRGYSANGDYKTALVHAKQALPLAPDETNKNSVQAMIQKLEKNQDAN